MRLSGIALALVLVSGGGALAESLDLDTDPASYRRAALAGQVGQVVGSIRGEPRHATDPGQPFVGTAVRLMPRSSGLVGGLEKIRREARTTPTSYLVSATVLRETREGYERALWRAGYPELTPATTVDATGAFAFEEVPAGRWLLMASRVVFVDKPSPRDPRRQSRLFSRDTRVVGYNAVSVWLRDLTVNSGVTTTVDLTDRGVWFTAIEEERVLDTGR